MGPVRAEVMAGVMLAVRSRLAQTRCSAASSEQVVLTWRAVYSFIDPAVYAVVSRIRKTDNICDQNAVRLGAGKLDEGGIDLCPPHAMHTLTRACVECVRACKPP